MSADKPDKARAAHHHDPATAGAAGLDVVAQFGYFPLIASARMGLFELYHVAEAQLRYQGHIGT